jgi:hypothetical protein
MHRASIYKILPSIVLALLAPVARAGDALNFFNNWFVTGDYVVGGVGLRATGVNGWATGTINITGAGWGGTGRSVSLLVHVGAHDDSCENGYFN